MKFLFFEKIPVDFDKWVRRVSQLSFWLFAIGGMLVFLGLALSSIFPAPVLLGGVLFILGSLIARAVVLVDRRWRKHRKKSDRKKSSVVPEVYTCHHCGYQLRGVRGVRCPECGTVRQTFTEDNDIDISAVDRSKLP